MKRLFSLLLIVLCPIAFPGGSEGHSAGKKWDADNPWFLGDEAASYCLEISKDTRYSRTELQQMVRESFDDWKKFFVKYGYDKLYLGKDVKFMDGKLRRLTLDFSEIPRCDKPDEQLRIVFSKTPAIPVVQEAPSGLNLGAAIRGPYNHTTYRTGGEVWIDNRTDSFRKPPMDAIKNIVLHELGHVFGMRHNEVFVMYENAASLSYEKNSMIDGVYEPCIGKIELPGWKFRQPRRDDTIYFPYGKAHTFEAWEKSKDDPFPNQRDFCSMLLNDKNKKCEIGVRMRFDGLGPYSKYFEGSMKYFTLLLKVQDTATKKVESLALEGEFDPYELESLGMSIDEAAPGPAVATRWQNYRPIASFYPMRPILPASGYLTYKGTRLPTVIDQGKGTNMKIWLPNPGFWYHFQGFDSNSHMLEDEEYK